MKAFLGYSRSDASVAAFVAEDLRQLGHTVWYDREVLGGQTWWSAILQQIRECDFYVFILTRASLDSQACRYEYTYAYQLQKRVLPVLCSDGVKINLLPPELSVIQFVDYRAQDKQAMIAILKSIQGAPEAVPLPDPLPADPPIPISYLGDLRAQIESTKELTLAQQRELLLEVKQRLKDPESGADAWDLLELLRRRSDLLSSVGDEIDETLEHKRSGKRQRKKSAVRQQAPVEQRIAVKEDAAPPREIAVNGNPRIVEALVERVIATQESWALKAEGDSLVIAMQDQKLVLTATFARWGEKDAKCLTAMGWTPATKTMQAVAGLALGALTVATSGLGLGLLMHKGTRDYLNKNQATRQFSSSQAKEAGTAIVECFRILRPEVEKLTVSNG